MQITEKHDSTFQKILQLCDIAEKMASAIQSSEVKNKEELLSIVTPVIVSVDNAVKVVSDVFMKHIEADEKQDKARSHEVDMAMKAIYDALYRMKEKGELLAERLQKETHHG